MVWLECGPNRPRVVSGTVRVVVIKGSIREIDRFLTKGTQTRVSFNMILAVFYPVLRVMTHTTQPKVD